MQRQVPPLTAKTDKALPTVQKSSLFRGLFCFSATEQNCKYVVVLEGIYV